ncbi:MAG TPA: UPF0182 family protein [Candidatus Nitrosopolaris sp.]|nr:UPF0182 family protein [Candidatus Nitrosopolaris sp.]
MWNPFNEDSGTPGFKIWRIVRVAVFVIIGLIIFWVASSQSVNLFMNVVEFENVFTKPLYYSIVSGLILCSIAAVRVDYRHRNSITWYGIHLLVKFLKRDDNDSSASSSSFYSRTASKGPKLPLRYPDFKMEKRSFVIWQITKVVLFAPLFTNLIFGISAVFLLGGHDLGLGLLPNIFLVPFTNIPSDGSFAQQHVIPLIPVLTLIIPSLLSAIGIRIFLYIGVSGGISIATRYMADTSESKPKLLSYISTMEQILGVTLLWTGFTMFFNFNINYNTKYAILGTLIMGALFVAYGFLDSRRSRIIVTPERKQIYTRLFTILIITIVSGSLMAISNTIADAKKIEWGGPYIAQAIAVNRYIAELDKVQTVNYGLAAPPPLSSSSSASASSSIPPPSISAIVNGNNDTLNNIRLWDQQAAQLKLKPQLGQKNDVNFADTNIVRFNNTMYWAAPTAPNLPADVSPENIWFNEHFVYTHSSKGVLMMEANTANVIDSSKFFKQKNIYYGESGPTGIFNQAWSAFPVGRALSDEIEGAFYTGTGGVNVAPPLSWVFEPKFMLSYTDSTMHVMRYKDIFDRMKVMYPYFVYDFTQGASQANINIRNVGVVPVTDGKNTYWLMPLIVFLDTSHVPWSSGDMLRLVGFALIDAYSGSVKIIKNPADDNNDPFSQIFFEQYAGINAGGDVTVLSKPPEWLSKQLIYPEEMFLWKINRFNQYHVTDPKTFVEAQQFYEAPDQVSTNYIITKPPGFDKPQFVGMQPLQLSNSPASNLVGYMVVQNNLENFGKMIFYSVPLDSTTKLLGPGAARDALEKDPTYAKEKGLLRNARVGDSILYRIGNQEAYFIPVYTASTSGSGVIELGTIAVVGASVNGNVFVGLGDTPQQALENYLLKAAGLGPLNQTSGATIVANGTSPPTSSNASANAKQQQQSNQTLVLHRSERIAGLEKIFVSAGLTVLKPTVIYAPISFREADVIYLADSQVGLVKSAITKFLQEFLTSGPGGSTPASPLSTPPRIFEWQSNANKVVNFGILKVVNGILENHYISIHLG